jgi:hypothetical protein
MRAMMPWLTGWALVCLVPACTQSGDARPAWLDLALSQDAIDPPLGEQSVTASLPLAPPLVTYEDQPPDTDPVCHVQRHSKIARVTIDAIVRDYHNPNWDDQHWTVYRLRVQQTIKGSALPEVVYSATVTGCFACRDFDQANYAFPASRHKVGEQGVAFLSQYGLDPIRPRALVGTNEKPLFLPARVMFFGMFLPERPDGTLDGGRGGSNFAQLVGESFSYQDLEDLISRIGTVKSCEIGGPTRCDACDTSQHCYEDFQPSPCACANDYEGCTQLPPEDPIRSRLYQP